MAGPINGIGGQQQVPLANSFKPGESGDNQQVRPNTDAPAQENVVQAQNAQAAQVQNTETGNQNILQDQLAAALEPDSGEDLSSQPRGSLLDIKV